jgi:tetratricopeptide (TPR) repeat protein
LRAGCCWAFASGLFATGKAMMTRAIASAAVVGALLSGLASYAASQPPWRNLIAVWFDVADRTTERIPVTEGWPICTTMASVALDTDWAQLDPDFAAGKKALGAEDWNAAIAALKLALLRDPQNADIQNYIGYAYRRLRQLEPAFVHYRQALELNPRHRSAREHLGESYLVKGDLAKAEEQLAALESICLIPCAELGDLQAAIAAYKRTRSGPSH